MDLEETVLEKVFTEVGETVDAKVNKLTAKCIDSENDTFSLDSEGNLSVNSITTRTSGTGQGISVDTIYPIGSIYLSVTDTNPSTLFGGVWEQISKGRTLVGVDPSQEEFDTPKKAGGSKYLQQHNHNGYSAPKGTPIVWEAGGNYRAYYDITFSTAENTYTVPVTNEVTQNIGTGNCGNLQPYFTCYIWCRIA